MENFNLFIKIFLPLFVVALLLITYVLNIISFKNKYGIDPRATKSEDTIMFILELYRSILFFATVLVIIIYSFFPDFYKYLIPAGYLETIYLQIVGVILLVFGLILARVAQIQLKSSYRMGIDRNETNTELITSGVYRWSRNPITLSLLIITIGIFLIIPNIITFALPNMTFLIISIRSRIEEEHLLKLHGDHYLQYKKRTRRWI